MSRKVTEEEKAQFRENRKANQKLSEIVQQGTRYHETIKVRAIDTKEYEVEVHALSEDEFRELFEKAGVDPRDIGNRDKLVQNMKFLGSVAAKATQDEQICSVLMPNESAKIMIKAFEISGLTSVAADKADSFQPKQVQSDPVRSD